MPAPARLAFPSGRRFDLACLGRFLVQTLQREGCDTSRGQVDPERLTGLVLLGLKDRDTFPLLFMRENCADMAIDAAAIDEDFIIVSRHACTPAMPTPAELAGPGVRTRAARRPRRRACSTSAQRAARRAAGVGGSPASAAMSSAPAAGRYFSTPGAGGDPTPSRPVDPGQTAACPRSEQSRACRKQEQPQP